MNLSLHAVKLKMHMIEIDYYIKRFINNRLCKVVHFSGALKGVATFICIFQNQAILSYAAFNVDLFATYQFSLTILTKPHVFL
jgi:hypothetical protein